MISSVDIYSIKMYQFLQLSGVCVRPILIFNSVRHTVNKRTNEK